MHLSTISLNKKCHALDQAMNLSDLPAIERKTGSESSLLLTTSTKDF